ERSKGYLTEEEQKELVGKRLTRSSRNEQSALESMNRKLNIGIAIVSTLILIVTAVILNGRGSVEDSAAKEEQNGTPAVEQQQEEQPVINEEKPPTEVSEGENVISESADANVIEVWTNPSWQPFPTKQTGEHTSVFEAGHIDYEEKLAAAFTVLPIEQANSYVTSARNNGDAKSARIVVTNKDKSENYRVIIQWVEGQGWLPTSVDVLQSAEGVR
ncbi:MAG: YrrS family protein, partial [Lysinibacillus sp.]